MNSSVQTNEHRTEQQVEHRTEHRTEQQVELTHENIIPTVVAYIKKEFTHDILYSLQCTNGNTQDRENKYKSIIRDILGVLQIQYDEASSQQPYDFRLHFGGITYWVEIKKLDNTCSKLNDTYPKEESHYIFLYTAKNKLHTPGVLYVRGTDFPDRAWVNKRKHMIDFFRKSSKSPSTKSSVYPRLNISLDASFFVPLLQQEGCIPSQNKIGTRVKTTTEINQAYPFISTTAESLLQDDEFAKNWTGDKTMLYNALKKALE